MANRIHIHLEWLSGLRDDLSTTTEQMRSLESRDTINFTEAGDVPSAHRQLMDAWTRRRDELTKTFSTVEKLVSHVHDTFQQADTALARELGG